ncbi:hypothetical protein LFZ20_11550 [Salmonella enterica subsp. enterica serovar Johannesburg str. SA20025782]|nr:hypothetical protein LFZ20_11550 [Salmonella enterica subsp. enterica serovar Johannesburg str. SA20025782]
MVNSMLITTGEMTTVLFCIEDLCPPDGLDARDMLALQYIKLKSPDLDLNEKNNYKDAYQFADNMIEARDKKPG